MDQDELELFDEEEQVDVVPLAIMIAEVGNPGRLVIEPDVFIEGGIYSVFEGTYGHYTSVFYKFARKSARRNGRSHRYLVRNDVRRMEEFAVHPNFAKIITHEITGRHWMLIVQRYSETLQTYVTTIGGRPAADQIDYGMCFKQLLQGLSFIHSRLLVHRDIRMKNLFIHRFNGKISENIIFSHDLKHFFHRSMVTRHWRVEVHESD